jgi:predicted enzyme related to lactoylglutathione lyase
MTSRIMSLPIDAADPRRLADFWADVLGWVVTGTGWQRTEHGRDGATIAPAAGGAFEIDFRWVPDPQSAIKSRLHLDVNPTDGDQTTELERLLALGARQVDVGQGPDVSWHVLADPEGNVFCLCRDRVPPLT